MRRLLVATLFLAGSAILSCDNAAYDADPKKDLSEARNPLDPNSGVTVYLGSIECVINREKMVFVNGKYVLREEAWPVLHILRELTAEAKGDFLFKRNFIANIDEAAYEAINDGGYPKEGGWDFTYQVADTSSRDRLLFHKYRQVPGKYFKMTVVGQDGTYMRGKFEGVLYKSILGEDKVTPTDEFDMTDSVVITHCEFYLPRQ